MSKRNVKRIIIGLVLIIGAIGAALMAFYYLEVKPTLEQEYQESPLSSVITVAPSAKVEAPQPARVVEPLKPAVVKQSAEKPVIKTVEKSVVSQGKKEGFLWVDKKSSKFVITLGASQGVVAGERLIVYNNNNQKIATVVVNDVYDAIAYVTPLDTTSQSFPQDYYRVVRE